MLAKFGFAAAFLATTTLADVCLEKTERIPAGWTRMNDTVDVNQMYSFAIALKQPQMEDLHSLLAAPKALLFSLTDLTKMRAPAPEAASMVEAWLYSHGIRDVTVKDDWVNVRASVAQTDALIGSQLEHYIYEGTDKPVLRTTQYYVPDALADAIDFIHPISNFMQPVRSAGSQIKWLNETEYAQLQKRAGPGGSGMSPGSPPPCSDVMTPDCIRELYNFYYTTPDEESSVTLGVAGFLGEYANYRDSDKFLQEHARPLSDKGYNYTVELVNGGENPQDLASSGPEAALDIDYTLGLGYPANIVFYSTGGRSTMINEDGSNATTAMSTNEPFIELFQYFLDMEGDIPSILSISYSDDEVSVPRPYAHKVCNMIGMLAGRGMTVLFGSGDGGATGGHGSNCRTRDGKGKKIAMTTFPSTCPYALAVGATTSADDPEAAPFSTGGFSQYFTQPYWQREVVGKYVRSIGPLLKGYYEPSNRAIPDISAVGTNLLVVAKGKPALLQGTSASTPIIASMLAMVNDARARAGRGPLGWVHKYLYSRRVRDVLSDITTGESMSCKWGIEKPGGWPAKAGWDAVTGLGTPKDFTRLLDVLVHADY